MIRNLLILGAVIGLSLLGLQWLLEGSHLINLADRYISAESAPMVEYYAGQVFYTVQDYDNASWYFRYVMTRYPASSYAEPANAFWLECRSQHLYSVPAQAVADCKAFLKQYPKSAYAPRVQKILERCELATLR